MGYIKFKFVYIKFDVCDCILFLQAAPVNIVIGSHVWVEDPVLAWIDGEVTRINGLEVHVHTKNGKTVSASLTMQT